MALLFVILKWRYVFGSVVMRRASRLKPVVDWSRENHSGSGNSNRFNRLATVRAVYLSNGKLVERRKKGVRDAALEG